MISYMKLHFSVVLDQKMIRSALASDARVLGHAKYMVVIIITTFQEALYQGKPGNDLKQLDKANGLCVGMGKLIVVSG